LRFKINNFPGSD